MKKVSVLAACILLAGSAIAADPQVKVAVAEVEKAVPSKIEMKHAPASAARLVAAVKVSASEALIYDYRLERESCCGPQN